MSHSSVSARDLLRAMQFPRLVPVIKKVFEIHNSKLGKMMVICEWDDNTKTRATCAPDDTYDVEVGIAVCIRKKFLPEKQFKYLMKKKVSTLFH